jgi:heme ABC exporter ATP-binding subunit CcmA
VNTSYLEIRGLKKHFGLKPILRGVDLSVNAGERVALLGANGAGKTTLLRILAGLTRPGAGQIMLDGLNLLQQTRAVRRKIGFVAHQPYLYDELTALENLLFFARMYALEQPQARAVELLQRVGLSKKARERAHSLSRGQLQRLALARALLHRPQLLLLDEAETGLDQEGLEVLNELLQEHRAKSGTILFTTHDLERAIERSDRIALLHQGRLAYQELMTSQEQQSIRQVYREVVG